MISRPSGESEAKTVTGSTSAGSLGEAQDVTPVFCFIELKQTFVHLEENSFDTNLGSEGR